MLRKMLPASVLLAALVGWTQAAHAKGGLIMDLVELGGNVLNGTIPPLYTAAFGVLVLLILILGIAEARKNARATAQNPGQSSDESRASNAGSVDLGKRG